ncbi:MAG: hypothetical protein H6R24_742 [Proteobacteria bacterium]|jgi:hypothetical protein|nr:hypothetical protein [Pseudomonadota bacterium]
MEKPSVYVETSVISYLASKPSRDVIVAGHQQLTLEWWDTRDEWRLFVSPLVIREAGGGDADAAARRLAFTQGLTVIADKRRCPIAGWPSPSGCCGTR